MRCLGALACLLLVPVAAAADVPRKYDRAQLSRGERIYNANCLPCHGSRGKATPNWRTPGPDGKYPPPPLDDTAHAWHHPTAVLKKVIREGSPPGQGNMPAWKGKLSEQQIDDVVAWITSLWSDRVYAVWYRQIEHPQGLQPVR